MRGVISFIFFILVLPGIAFSQSRQLTLSEIQKNAVSLEQEAEVRIINYLKNNPEERVTYLKNGGIHMLVDVTPNGVPVYRQTFNAQEATTLNVPSMRSGGGLGIDMLGTGIRLGTWDGGKVLLTHVELVGRVTQLDNPSSFSDHATHTSGTMMASGVNASAKGMAPEATLVAYDFNNDVSEMSAQARPNQTTLLLSNHSYGTVAGWDTSVNPAVWRGDASISTTIDYKFGFYDSRAAQFDAIAFSAPYYTIVKAAGNDRGDNGTGGPQRDGGALGFDCIPTESGAKNIITVGAVQNVANYTQPSNVVMSSFSGWGPTDDGRIKPDIVAPGISVFSSIATGGNNQYDSYQGTSMATPATTGTLALLQQLYKSLNSGNYMRSATLKALILHSAKEAGLNPGPDYSFGWGLLDAGAAAKLIINKDNQNIFITESSLTSGQAFEINLGIPKTATKVTATLVWTDPAGTPTAPALNPTAKMLVNDLDLRLIDDGNTSQFPWTLNPANPAAAAITGDNVRDNVEKIEFNSTLARTYKIQVTNKNTLVNGPQAFSLIVEYSSQTDPRTTYYWIGNDGAWEDPAHWSLTSGGASSGIVPGANDRVVFNEQSFSAASVVTMNANQSCYSLRWFGDQYAVNLSMNNKTLTVAENMTLLTTKLTTSTAGTISFASTATVANGIDLNSNILDKLSLDFNGNSSWNVTGTASVDKVILTQGSVTFNNSALHLNQLSPSGGSAKTLAFTTASIQALTGLNVDFTGITVQSDNTSLLIVSPTVTNTFNFGNANFQGIISMAGGDVTLTGTNTLRSIQGNGIVRLNGTFLVSNLNLSGGSQLILQQGSTQTFTDKISFATTTLSRVKIMSSGGANATFALNDYYKICTDNIDVTNVDVSGNSLVNAGAGSTLTNSANWLKVSCGDILFPDFSIAYTCAKSSTYFTDKSSGPITSRLWTFGDPASGTSNTSTLVSPLHYYASGGPFTVTLTVTGASGSKPLSKTVTLTANDLADNTIQFNNGSLISTVLSNNYQWLKDGQLISGATARSYNTGTSSGAFSVLTFSTLCNKRSDPFVVTALEPETVLGSFNTVKVYPNPTSDVLQVESEIPVVSIQIWDALGKESKVEVEQINNKLYRVNVSYIPSGLYILRTTTKEKTDVQKIIIRK